MRNVLLLCHLACTPCGTLAMALAEKRWPSVWIDRQRETISRRKRFGRRPEENTPSVKFFFPSYCVSRLLITRDCDLYVAVICMQTCEITIQRDDQRTPHVCPLGARIQLSACASLYPYAHQLLTFTLACLYPIKCKVPAIVHSGKLRTCLHRSLLL
jgi:hypothetical protein